MSLINDYLKKTQDQGPPPEQPGDVPPLLKSSQKAGSGKIVLRVSAIAVLGIIAGVAYYNYQSSVKKSTPAPELLASLGETAPRYSTQSKDTVDTSSPANSSEEQQETEGDLPAAGAVAAVPASSAAKSTAEAEKPAQTVASLNPTPNEVLKVAEAEPEVAGKPSKPLAPPKKPAPVAQAAPTVTIAHIKKPEKHKTVEVDLNHYFQLGLMAQKDGNFREAEKFYREVLVQHPAHLGALTNLAAVYIHQKKTTDAEKTLRKVLRIDPKNTKALVNLGIINLTLNEREQAKTRFQKALMIDPREETALVNLAFLANQENNAAQAEKYYKDILSISPQNVEVLLAYASLLEKDSRFEEALSCYQRSLDAPALNSNRHLQRQVTERIDLLRYYSRQ